MTESQVEWAERHALTFDYDLRRWVRVPEPGSATDKFIDAWAGETAKAWANDLGRTQEGNWTETLTAMCAAAARIPYSTPPDAVFLHLLAPPEQAPSPAIATLLSYPADEPLDQFAAALADQYLADPETARPPALEPTTLSDGRTAWLVTAYLRDEDQSLRIAQHVMFQVHELMHVVLTLSDEDIARALQTTDDLIALAAAVALVERPA